MLDTSCIELRYIKYQSVLCALETCTNIKVFNLTTPSLTIKLFELIPKRSINDLSVRDMIFGAIRD